MSIPVAPEGYTTRDTTRAYLPTTTPYPDYTGTEPCATTPINYWLSPHIHYQSTAKHLCTTCPLLTECRDYATTTREPSGIWGATNPNERGSRLG